MRFTVGELAKLAGVSKQMLIYYDNMDVFKPRLVGSENGYRYYTADQLEQLDTVLMLREMGFSLKEIRLHMEQRSTDTALDALRSQRELIRRDIRRMQAMDLRLARKLEDLERVLSAQPDNPFLSEQEGIDLAMEPVKKPYGLLEVDIALKRLLHRANERQYSYFYQLGDTVSLSALNKKNFLCFEHVFVPLLKRTSGETFFHKPNGQYACIYHRGPYARTFESYEKLLNFIQQQHLTPTGPAYEFCVLDSLTTSRPEEYLTEIQIPVETNN
ncbi:MerR family transcriptional regulator [uncultured Ruthenibacterium sp.]|uniref:MerR family transcriptional regulator n=1 Tax=uncultured Ruthenibacterium sp. TaxID=1905347 RepID=UPI00349E6CFF